MKLIEIETESKIKVHSSFMFPTFPGKMQRIFFSSDTQYLVERLSNSRTYIYKNNNSPDVNGNVRYEMIKKIYPFNISLRADTGVMSQMSPDLMWCFDFNDKLKQYIIKDINVDKKPKAASIPIPSHVIKFSPKLVSKEQMNRIHWINNDILKVINEEGIEKLVNIREDFKEIEFSSIPSFDLEECKDSHFETNRPSLLLSNVIGRLVRKYQKYKS